MSIKIGIPRALMYHYYYPSWETFFEELGMDIVLSKETNKKILEDGAKLAVDDICLPFKVYYGHILDIKDSVDYLFVPRFISLGKYNYVCPKFMGLPDMLKANMKSLPKIIEPVFDLRKGFRPLRKIYSDIASVFNKSFWQTEIAYNRAIKRQKKFEKLQKHGYSFQDAVKYSSRKRNINDSSAKIINESNKRENENIEKGLKIGVLGHSYILNDKYISMDIIGQLRDMGVDVRTVEMFEQDALEKAASQQNKRVFWFFNRQVMGAAYHLFNPNEKIDGLIQVTAFACGPDSMVQELIDIKAKKNDISVLNLNIDEHSAEAGLITRLEAFVDLIERRKMA
ncbi:acyl-CoA dehydratase activase-related protein [Natronospora cellulosivora (SeqCode)]